MLQHPEGVDAPAELVKDSATAQSVLGIVPHQLRGQLGQFRADPMVGHAYDKCTACSQTVMRAYADKGFEFLLSVFEDPKTLEQITGLEEMKKQADAWTGDEEGEEDDF